MTAPAPAGTSPVGEERHASWLELFFDLVVVAGIGMLAHLLQEDHDRGGLALYVIAYTAFWLVWACFTTYGNVAGEGARALPILAGMAALAVMIAAVPGIHDEHAQAFAVAYVVGRLVAARPWRRTTVVVDLPVVQALTGVVPWIVSWWFDGQTRYTLWAVGLAIDLLLLLTLSGERLVRRAQERLDEVRERRGRGPGARRDRPGRGDRERPLEGSARRTAGRTGRGGRRGADAVELPTTVDAAVTDVPHLGERLGLFVIIVLGEGLIQAIDAASGAEWDRTLLVAGAGAFTLLVALWALTVRSGYAGVTLLRPAGVPPRSAWFLHLVTTGALATLAGALGGVLDEPARALDPGELALLVGAFAVHGLVSAGVHAVLRDVRTAVVLAGPVVVAGAVAWLAGGTISAAGLVWVLSGALLVQLALAGRPRAASAPAGADA
ncbi:low temperature requirement protein A [Cellulosimicrobium cellulans]|uniref:low temperature requirement protein A n=1 Tax=Cellulosimicrobium cellulans TaxID=1710 RepID=UPI002096E4AC|nr:low temperature requirement protein A [Cellulosimicrobium cellulans]MCO7271827.1 low temperature requirement protein A [Cellulosimicrobium cellulans]